jgi:hypothetical protein
MNNCSASTGRNVQGNSVLHAAHFEHIGEVAAYKEMAAGLVESAQRLAGSIERHFWGEELGTYGIAIDGAARFNPMSYHNGSVWPHDDAMIAIGFANYGLKQPVASLFAQRACLGLKFEPLSNRIVLASPVLPPFLDSIVLRNVEIGPPIVGSFISGPNVICRDRCHTLPEPGRAPSARLRQARLSIPCASSREICSCRRGQPSPAGSVPPRPPDFGHSILAVVVLGRLLNRRKQLPHDVLLGTVIVNTSAGAEHWIGGSTLKSLTLRLAEAMLDRGSIPLRPGDTSLTRHAAVLSDSAFALPVSSGPQRAQGIHPSRG